MAGAQLTCGRRQAVARAPEDPERAVLALTFVVLLVAVAFVLVTSGALIGPSPPRSGPEAWVVRDDARTKRQEQP